MDRQQPAERERHWRSVLHRQRKSGQSVRAFCQQNAISQATFYNWRRRLTPSGPGERSASTAAIESSSRTARSTAFIPLKIKGLMSSGSVIEVVHPRGHLVRIPAAFDGEALHRIFTVLDQGGA